MQTLRRGWQYLVQPTSTNFKEIFRERTIRALALILIIVASLAWIASVSGVYGSATEDFYLLAIGLAIILLVSAEIAVLKHRVELAGYLMISVFLMFAVIVHINLPGAAAVINPVYAITLFLVSLLVPFNLVVPA